VLKLSGGLVVFFLPLMAAEAPMPAPSCSLVPGWTQAGPPRIYTADNLYDYMDGNSEGYFLYNFREMRGVTCKQGDVTFVVDISDMGDADYAYGMFCTTRDLRQPAYPAGMGGQIVPRRLIFAKGQYYAEVAADPEGDHSAALRVWAAALDKALPGSVATPPILAWFPTEKQQSLRLMPQSVLGLRILKRGYMAQYDYGKAFIVVEDSPTSAAAAMEQWKTRLGQTTLANVGEEAFQATDQYLGRLCVFRKGRYIGGYAVVDGSTDPVALSTALAAKMQ
jgi:hypothetical protein